MTGWRAPQPRETWRDDASLWNRARLVGLELASM